MLKHGYGRRWGGGSRKNILNVSGRSVLWGLRALHSCGSRPRWPHSNAHILRKSITRLGDGKSNFGYFIPGYSLASLLLNLKKKKLFGIPYCRGLQLLPILGSYKQMRAFYKSREVFTAFYIPVLFLRFSSSIWNWFLDITEKGSCNFFNE